MIKLNYLSDDRVMLCTLEGVWTLNIYHQMIYRMETMSKVYPRDVILDLRESQFMPINLLDLMHQGIELARRHGIHVVLLSEKPLFVKVYRVVNTTSYQGQDTSLSFAHTLEEAKHIVKYKHNKKRADIRPEYS